MHPADYPDPDTLSEDEIVRRIGALFAKATRLYWRAERLAGRDPGNPTKAVQPVRDVADLVHDETEKQIVRYLARVGAASPHEMCLALDVPRTTLTGKLARLRAIGLITVSGKTKAARYALRRSGDATN